MSELGAIQTTLIGNPNDTGGTIVSVDPTTVADNVFVFDAYGQKWKRISDGPYRAAWVVNRLGSQTSRLQAVFNHPNVYEVVFDDGDVTLSGTLTIPAGKVITFRGNGAVIGTYTISGGIVHSGRYEESFKGTPTLNIAGVRGGSTKDPFTLATDGSRVVPVGAYVKRVLVKSSSNLTGFKVGTSSGADNLTSTQPNASGEFVPYNIDKYYEAGGFVHFGGITSSTKFIIFYE